MKEELGESSAHNQLMDIVLREVACLNSLIADFLLFARPAPPGKDLVPLNDLVEEILIMFGNSADCNPRDPDRPEFSGSGGPPRRSPADQAGHLEPSDQRGPGHAGWRRFNRRAAPPAPHFSHADQPAQCEISISDSGTGIAEGDVEKFSIPSSPPKKTAPAWVFPSCTGSWKITAEKSGSGANWVAAPPSPSISRFNDKNCQFIRFFVIV